MFRSKPSMIHHCLCLFQSLLLIALLPAVSLAVPGSDRAMPDKQAILDKLPGIRIPFIENKGQMGDESVRYYARTLGGTLFVTESGEIVYSLPFIEKSESRNRDFSRWVVDHRQDVDVVSVKGVSLKETLLGATVKTISGRDMSASKVNFFHGDDLSRWQNGLSSYEMVSLGEVYPGIELVLKAYGNNVEKLFTVKPHSDPRIIKINIEGAKAVEVASNGELEITTDMGLVRFTKPVAFQEIGGKRVDVPVQYALQKANAAYSFNVSNYDRTRDLFIDPLLASTFLGKASYEMAQAIALDASGNVYVTGFTNSSDFPTTTGSYDLSYNGTRDVFVSKISGDLTQLLASTFLGGSNDDEAQAIALDASGNVYVSGITYSSDFPTTLGAYDASKNSSGGTSTNDVFITKISGDMKQLLASTYLGGGGDDFVYALRLDNLGNVYVAGFTKSGDFPTTSGAYNTSRNGTIDYDDGFISKLNGNLTQLLASTFFGGSDHDRISAMSLDGSGNIYVAGTTKSLNFPTTGGAYDTSNNNYDAFISKFNGSLDTLLVSTYLGGSGTEAALSIDLDIVGNIYVTGITYSSDFPTTSGAYNTSFNGGDYDIFISKLSNDLTNLSASTFLGGGSNDFPYSLSLNATGNALYVSGYTLSSNFPVTPWTYDGLFNGIDAFISKFSSNLDSLISSTFLGGTAVDQGFAMALDSSRNVYVTGITNSVNFPTSAGAYDSSHNGYYDIFISKFDSTLRRLNPKGDVDRNDIVNLADAILAIQVSSGMSSASVTLDADVNVDDRIGLAEVIYILQKVAGIRQ